MAVAYQLLFHGLHLLSYMPGTILDTPHILSHWIPKLSLESQVSIIEKPIFLLFPHLYYYVPGRS